MKAVILAAGKGSRLSELKLRHKSLAVINNKKIIEYSLDMIFDANKITPINEIIIVVGHNAGDIIDYVGNSYKGINVQYVFQKELKGIAHAMLTAKPFINDDAIMCLADEILIKPELSNMIQCFYSNNADSIVGVVEDENDFSGKPIGYLLDDNGFIKDVMEKPTTYFNKLRGIGECIFSKNCLDYLDILTPNKIRGEYEMGDWIQLIIKSGKKVLPFVLADDYVNVNYKQDIEFGNALTRKVS